MEWMILPLKRYADFQGRSRRLEYWMFYLLQILIAVAFALLGVIVGGASGGLGRSAFDPAAAAGGTGIISILNALVSLALLVPSLAVGVRRLHDTDRTGWWLLAPLAPLIFLIIAVVGAAGTLLGRDPSAAGAGLAGGLGITVIIAAVAFFVAAITVFVFTVLEGTRGPNRFGADPKNPAGDLTSVFR